MKAYKIELLVIDFDGLGQQGVVETIESRRWPNDCISPSVEACQEADIGVWTDDHPLNRKDTAPAEYARIFPATSPAPAVVQMTDEQPKLTVWYGSMPESNGKSNYTAILNRADAKGLDAFCGFTIARSEYPDRVRYEADCVRHLIGELPEKPCITDYDADKHSGYVAPAALAKQVPAQEQALAILREFVRDSVEHDVGGGDVVVTTCEVLEKACKLVDSLRDPSLGVCGVKPSECPDHTRCGCEKRMAAQLAQSADKAEG